MALTVHLTKTGRPKNLSTGRLDQKIWYFVA